MKTILFLILMSATIGISAQHFELVGKTYADVEKVYNGKVIDFHSESDTVTIKYTACDSRFLAVGFIIIRDSVQLMAIWCKDRNSGLEKYVSKLMTKQGFKYYSLGFWRREKDSLSFWIDRDSTKQMVVFYKYK